MDGGWSHSGDAATASIFDLTIDGSSATVRSRYAVEIAPMTRLSTFSGEIGTHPTFGGRDEGGCFRLGLCRITTSTRRERESALRPYGDCYEASFKSVEELVQWKEAAEA